MNEIDPPLHTHASEEFMSLNSAVIPRAASEFAWGMHGVVEDLYKLGVCVTDIRIVKMTEEVVIPCVA